MARNSICSVVNQGPILMAGATVFRFILQRRSSRYDHGAAGSSDEEAMDGFADRISLLFNFSKQQQQQQPRIRKR